MFLKFVLQKEFSSKVCKEPSSLAGDKDLAEENDKAKKKTEPGRKWDVEARDPMQWDAIKEAKDEDDKEAEAWRSTEECEKPGNRKECSG